MFSFFKIYRWHSFMFFQEIQSDIKRAMFKCWIYGLPGKLKYFCPCDFFMCARRLNLSRNIFEHMEQIWSWNFRMIIGTDRLMTSTISQWSSPFRCWRSSSLEKDWNLTKRKRIKYFINFKQILIFKSYLLRLPFIALNLFVTET